VCAGQLPGGEQGFSFEEQGEHRAFERSEVGELGADPDAVGALDRVPHHGRELGADGSALVQLEAGEAELVEARLAFGAEFEVPLLQIQDELGPVGRHRSVELEPDAGLRDVQDATAAPRLRGIETIASGPDGQGAAAGPTPVHVESHDDLPWAQCLPDKIGTRATTLRTTTPVCHVASSWPPGLHPGLRASRASSGAAARPPGQVRT